MIPYLKLINFALIILSAVLIYKNRKLQYQEVPRALFAVVVCLFIYSLVAF